MKINNLMLSISLALAVSGCVPRSPNPNVTSIEVVKPPVGQSATAYMGDPIITSATGFKTDVLELGAGNGALSSIAAGSYCSVGNGVYRNYHNPQAVALKIFMDRLETMLIMLVTTLPKTRFRHQMVLLILPQKYLSNVFLMASAG